MRTKQNAFWLVYIFFKIFVNNNLCRSWKIKSWFLKTKNTISQFKTKLIQNTMKKINSFYVLIYSSQRLYQESPNGGSRANCIRLADKKEKKNCLSRTRRGASDHRMHFYCLRFRCRRGLSRDLFSYSTLVLFSNALRKSYEDVSTFLIIFTVD